MLGAIFKEVK
jgi:hypothetical protein